MIQMDMDQPLYSQLSSLCSLDYGFFFHLNLRSQTFVDLFLDNQFQALDFLVLNSHLNLKPTNICKISDSKIVNSNSHPQYYRSFSEHEQFIDFNSFKKNDLPSIKELVELRKSPKLLNIENSLVNDPNSAQVIKSIKSLRHLTLGYDWQQNDEFDSGLIKQLREKIGLIALLLIGLKLESKQVDQIIQKNPYLKNIIIRNLHENQNINDETVECMSSLIYLQNLCISNNIAITGKHISKLKKLLMLCYCQKVSKKHMKEAQTEMQKLQHFNINYNEWVDTNCQ